MVERLTGLEASFLYLEEPSTPMHLLGVFVLDRGAGGIDAIAELVRARLELLPRYRQCIVEVPGRLANPVWVDDVDFELDYHVRRSALPRPGTPQQLLDLVSRLASRSLDRSRPMWELYLVEGIEGGRAAVVTKTHPALVDGLGAMEIGQVLLSRHETQPPPAPAPWRPRTPPTPVELVRGALEEYVRRPTSAVDRLVRAAADFRVTGARVAGAAGSAVRAVQSALVIAPSTPFDTVVGPQRRVAVARLSLADVKTVRRAHGGTVHEVLLAVVTGALREWLLSRGRAVVGGTTVRALVPVSVQGEGEAVPGTRVAPYLVDLPVGEPNPRLRLARLGYAMRGVSRHGPVGADSLIALTGFAPPTMHALGARAARTLSRRMFNLMITNVPGPQVPLFVAGSRLREAFSVVPLARGHGLSVGMTSYDGRVFVALNADRDVVGDVDVLADLVEQQIEELTAAAR